jgi:putative FmdB family regulatory protein
MPKYTYHCSECGNTYDVVHPWKEDLSSCNICNSKQIQKIVTNFLIAQTRNKTEIEETIKVNKEKLKKMKEDSKHLTYEDIKND